MKQLNHCTLALLNVCTLIIHWWTFNVKMLYLIAVWYSISAEKSERPMKNDVEIRNFYYNAKMCYFLIKFKAWLGSHEPFSSYYCTHRRTWRFKWPTPKQCCSCWYNEETIIYGIFSAVINYMPQEICTQQWNEFYGIERFNLNVIYNKIRSKWMLNSNPVFDSNNFVNF